jgi:hypothetical protein
LAIFAAPMAIPVNPKIPATIAINNKMIVHFNISILFKGKNNRSGSA